jgi:hypothetical protein
MTELQKFVLEKVLERKDFTVNIPFLRNKYRIPALTGCREQLHELSRRQLVYFHRIDKVLHAYPAVLNHPKRVSKCRTVGFPEEKE